MRRSAPKGCEGPAMEPLGPAGANAEVAEGEAARLASRGAWLGPEAPAWETRVHRVHGEAPGIHPTGRGRPREAAPSGTLLRSRSAMASLASSQPPLDV